MIVFMVAGLLVAGGYWLQEYALDTGNQMLINLSPDVFGSGLLVFVAGIVLWLLGRKMKL